MDARPPCPSPTPGVYSNSCPSSRWCHPTISSSVVPFSSCPQSLPASGSFPMSQLFTWGSQSIGISASAPVLPMNTQDWSPLGWTGWISLQSKGLSRVFSNTTVQNHQFFGAQLSSQLTAALTNYFCNQHYGKFSLIKIPLSLASPTTPSLTPKIVQDLFLKKYFTVFYFQVSVHLYFPSSSPEYLTAGIFLTYYSSGLEIIKQ